MAFLRALLVCCLVANTAFVFADEEASPPPKEDAKEKTQTKLDNRAARPLAKEVPQDKFDVKSHFDWGTYYDPKNVFCGKYDCYGILGFDYESFAQEKPTQKMITKRYRALSRHWHPDKSKHPEAKERFQVRTVGKDKVDEVDKRKQTKKVYRRLFARDNISMMRETTQKWPHGHAHGLDVQLKIRFIYAFMHSCIHHLGCCNWNRIMGFLPFAHHQVNRHR